MSHLLRKSTRSTLARSLFEQTSFHKRTLSSCATAVKTVESLKQGLTFTHQSIHTSILSVNLIKSTYWCEEDDSCTQ